MTMLARGVIVYSSVTSVVRADRQVRSSLAFTPTYSPRRKHNCTDLVFYTALTDYTLTGLAGFLSLPLNGHLYWSVRLTIAPAHGLFTL